MKTQTRSGETAEKAFIILKNAYAVIQNVAADVNVKGTSGGVSAGNDEHVTECWMKSVSCYSGRKLASIPEAKTLGYHITLG